MEGSSSENGGICTGLFNEEVEGLNYNIDLRGKCYLVQDNYWPLPLQSSSQCVIAPPNTGYFPPYSNIGNSAIDCSFPGWGYGVIAAGLAVVGILILLYILGVGKFAISYHIHYVHLFVILFYLSTQHESLNSARHGRLPPSELPMIKSATNEVGDTGDMERGLQQNPKYHIFEANSSNDDDKGFSDTEPDRVDSLVR